MSIDTKGLTLLVAEADALSQKATLTKAEQRRSVLFSLKWRGDVFR